MKRAKEKWEQTIEIMKWYWNSPNYDDINTQEERDILFREYRNKQHKSIFLMAWEWSEADLNYICRLVEKEFDWKIIEAYKTKIIRKWRRDVYILTDDNIKYRNLYNTMLKREQELYENKWEK